MTVAGHQQRLNKLPRLGWVAEPSPVRELGAVGQALGLTWLGIKEDHQLSALCGGTKVRKLDYLLAAEPWVSAEAWASCGALGSGHLRTLAAAADALDRRFAATCFWQEPTPDVLRTLAATALGAASLRYHHGRVSMALRQPGLIWGRRRGAAIVVPPGATCATGVLGLVRAGLELAVQIDAGALPVPDSVVVPLGTGGTAAGLALGLGLAGLPTRVLAVAATERVFTGRAAFDRLLRRTGELLFGLGLETTPAPVMIIRHFVGPGYGRASEASTAAVAQLASHGVRLEPIYSGKAMAWLLAHPTAGSRVLFWSTPARPAPEPESDAWRERLPKALRARLRDPARFRRRRLIVGGAAALSVAAIGLRVSGYPAWPAWPGRSLAVWEAHVVRAAAEALLPASASDDAALDRVAVNVDAYVATLPASVRRELHAAFALIEHGTPMSFRWRRLTDQEPAERAAHLETLALRGGLQRQLYRGVRDLVMLGFYQQPGTWPAIGYGGPTVDGSERPDPYQRLVAPAGALPRGLVRLERDS